MTKSLRTYQEKFGEGIHTLVSHEEYFNKFMEVYGTLVRSDQEALKLYGFRLRRLNEHLPEKLSIEINGQNLQYYNATTTGYIKKDELIVHLDEYKELRKLIRDVAPKRENYNIVNVLDEFDTQLMNYITQNL